MRILLKILKIRHYLLFFAMLSLLMLWFHFLRIKLFAKDSPWKPGNLHRFGYFTRTSAYQAHSMQHTTEDITTSIKFTLNESQVQNIENTLRRRPLILHWAQPFSKEQGWEIPQTETCGGGCDITKDRSLYEQSDALVFFMKTTDINDIPDPFKRSPRQLFVWWCHESPYTVKKVWNKTLAEFDNFFNLTMHYRTDSNVAAILMPHTARDWYLHKIGRSEESDVKTPQRYMTNEEFDNMFKELMKVKTKSTSWVVSDCELVPGAVKRFEFAKKMKSEGNVSVDIFGNCGVKLPPKTGKEFFDFLQTYKFYLAFENSRYCKNYVTEKFWYNSLYAGAVPVVWGPNKSDVEKVAPPHSFIHVDDFSGDPKQVTDYLKTLEQNITAYKEYFRWWTMPGFYPIHNFREYKVKGQPSIGHSFFDYDVNSLCHLCKILNKEQNKIKNVIPNLQQEFFGKENPECFSQ